jgi:hypothetical protein
MLVSKESLLSVWVEMEAIHHLRQEMFNQTTTSLPILIDKEALSDDFVIIMAKNHF